MTTIEEARTARRAGGVPQVLGAAVLWGTVGPAQVLAGSAAAPAAIGAARMLLGGLVLALCTVRPKALRTLALPGVRRWLLLSVLVTAAFQLCFLEAVDRTGAALATAAAFGTTPVAAGLCARALRAERLTPAWWRGTALAVAGIALLLVPGGGPRADLAGILLAVAAGASFAVYIAATGPLTRHGGDPSAAAPVSVLGAGLLVLPALLAAPEGLATPRTAALIAWLALGTTALGYLLFTRGVGRVGAATTATLSLAEPLVAALLGLLLGERPGPSAALGLALLLGGLALVALPGRGGGGPQRS
ncbi:DMT family transporter [Kitasatospora sp. NPDC001664]